MERYFRNISIMMSSSDDTETNGKAAVLPSLQGEGLGVGSLTSVPAPAFLLWQASPRDRARPPRPYRGGEYIDGTAGTPCGCLGGYFLCGKRERGNALWLQLVEHCYLAPYLVRRVDVDARNVKSVHYFTAIS